jgi:hypothetical protein
MYSSLIRVFALSHSTKVIELRDYDLRALHLKYKGFRGTALEEEMIRTSPAVAQI